MKRYALLSTAVVAGAAFFFQDPPVNLQAVTPGVRQTGHLYISGTAKASSVVGYSADTSGIAYGGDFRSVSTQGRGVLGNASALTGATYGGLFQAASNGGRGIEGIAGSGTGTTYGGFFSSLSNQGRGVYGQATASGGTTYGVYGKAVSPNGYGVFSEGRLAATGVISGNGSGLTALNASNLTAGTVSDLRLSSNVPLLGAGNLFTGQNQYTGKVYVGPRSTNHGTNEILGLSSTASDFAGMYVTVTGASGKPYYGYSDGFFDAYTFLNTDGTLRFHNVFDSIILDRNGRVGIGTATPISALDVRADKEDFAETARVTNGAPVSAVGTQRTAFLAASVGSNVCSGIIGYARSTQANSQGYGVTGYARTQNGEKNYGVYGEANGSGTGLNVGIYGAASNATTINYSGYFEGKIYAGTLTGGTKSFLIDHPLDPANKYLEHSSVESDERMNVYRGDVTTDGRGYATISVPNWFTALNEDIQYQLTVVDTADSDSFTLVKLVQKLKGDKFKIRTSAANTEVFWLVTGRRHDATSNHNPLEVEREKKGYERGRYLEPAAFGKDPSFAIVPGRLDPTNPQPQANHAPKSSR